MTQLGLEFPQYDSRTVQETWKSLKMGRIYPIDSQAVARADQKQPETADDLIEFEIFRRALEIKQRVEEELKSSPVAQIREETRSRIQELFKYRENDDVIKEEDEILKPTQTKFIDRFHETAGNILMGMRTGEGKTLTYMKMVLETLRQNPDKKVIITTPRKYLIDQMIMGCIHRFESLHPLKRHVESSLIIDTPQAVNNRIKSGKINPEEINLAIFDEGAVGAKVQTGNYATFKIFEQLPKNARVIIADGTPINLDYLQEQYKIREVFFEEDPAAIPAIHIPIVEAEETPEHTALYEEFVEILQASFNDLYNAINDANYSKTLNPLREYLKPINEKDIPHIERSEYDAMLKRLFEEAKHSGAEKTHDLMIKASFLAAYMRTQDIFTTIHSKTYSAAIRKIDRLKTNYEDPAQEKSQKTFLRALQIEEIEDYEESPLIKYRAKLKAHTEKNILHPKTAKLITLLKQAKSEGKRTLVLCNEREVAEDLAVECKKAELESLFIHGDTSKKNLTRQKFALNRFTKEDGPNILFATTALVGRGLDLPEIDYAVCYSPTDEEMQVAGRLRKGGTMANLCLGEGDIIKAQKNRRERTKFAQHRIQFMNKTNQQKSEELQKEAQISRFHGTKKIQHYVEDLYATPEHALDKTFSERFLLTHAKAPTFNQRYKQHTVQVALQDRTGAITYYYQFKDEISADKFYESVRNQQIPVIVNGRVKHSKIGDIYLVGTHTEGMFNEGIIPCPEQDADIENLKTPQTPPPPQAPKFQEKPVVNRKKKGPTGQYELF
ncbi:MAG: DEAD/DEAH box helicase [Candidatus Peregrinibacteria bacterium]